MAKPWGRLVHNYINHPKFLTLTANAICLWHEAKNYCDMHLTDGLIPKAAFKTFRFHGKKSMDLLTTPIQKPHGDGCYAPFLEAHPVGFKMHDYLEHNDCREVVIARMERAELEKIADRQRKADARAAKAAKASAGNPTGQSPGHPASVRFVSDSIHNQNHKQKQGFRSS